MGWIECHGGDHSKKSNALSFLVFLWVPLHFPHIFIVIHSFPLFFHWFSFMCFTIFIFLFFFPGCIGFFDVSLPFLHGTFLVWNLQLANSTEILTFWMMMITMMMVTMIFLWFSLTFQWSSSVFHWPPSMSLLFSFFYWFHRFFIGVFIAFLWLAPVFPWFSLFAFGKVLTCASKIFSLAPPTLTCASDLAHLRLQYSLAPPQCYDWIVNISLNVPPLCLPPCDHMKSKSLSKLSPPLPSTMRPSEI